MQQPSVARLLPVLSVGALLCSLLTVALGSIVRITGSSLACPDWPLCYGSLVPPLEVRVWVEYVHRLSASLVVLFTLGLGLVAFLTRSSVPSVLWSSVVAVLLLAAQAVVGAVVVLLEDPPLAGLVHMGLATFFVGSLAIASTGAVPALARLGRVDGGIHGKAEAPSRHLGAVTGILAASVALVLSGSYVLRSGASLACLDFPLCEATAVPASVPWLAGLQVAHRVAALATLACLSWALVEVRRLHPHASALLGGLAVALALFLVQAGFGIANVLLRLPEWARVGHVVGAVLFFGVICLLTAATWRAHSRPIGAMGRARQAGLTKWSPTLKAYLGLMKLNIVALLLVTTLAAMIAAAGGVPDVGLTFWTLVGGLLSAGAANTFNSYLDQDLDRAMARTRRRPLPSGRVSRSAALRFGVVLAVLSTAVFILFVNWLAALLASVAMAYYVLVYTAWLKRRTYHSVVIGGAAGAFPPVVGWVAVTGHIDLIALYLFAIVFFWTPPHAWALMLLVREDYRRAQVPMLPAVYSPKETSWQILLYSWLLFAITLAPAGAKLLGPMYLAASLALGTVFVGVAWALYHRPSNRWSRRLYKYSSIYLALLFLAVVLDRSLFS